MATNAEHCSRGKCCLLGSHLERTGSIAHWEHPKGPFGYKGELKWGRATWPLIGAAERRGELAIPSDERTTTTNGTEGNSM